MRDLTTQLHDLIADVPDAPREKKLTVEEERLFRSMKTHGERSTKGREVTKTLFEAKVKSRSGVSFLMLMEGRHAMSVGGQVARRFAGVKGVESVEVVKTKSGACVILRPKEL